MKRIAILLSFIILAGCGHRSSSNTGEIVAHGVLFSSESGAPRPGVPLHVVETDERVISDDQGAFDLHFPRSLDMATIGIGTDDARTLLYPIPKERNEYALGIGYDFRADAYFYSDYSTGAENG